MSPHGDDRLTACASCRTRGADSGVTIRLQRPLLLPAAPRGTRSQAASSVDGRDQHGQVHGLGLRDVRADLGADVVAHLCLGDQRHRLGPGEGAFAVGILREVGCKRLSA
jgi:hypothetical protein